MKIKIGDKITDANDEPVMLIFEDEQEAKTVAKHLSEMATESRKYCMYPEGKNEEDIRNFMKTE